MRFAPIFLPAESSSANLARLSNAHGGQRSRGARLRQNGKPRGAKRSWDDDDAEMELVPADTGGNTENEERTRLLKRRATGSSAIESPVLTPAPMMRPIPKSALTQTRRPSIAASTRTNGAARPPLSRKSSTYKLDTHENFLGAVNLMDRGQKLEGE